MVPLDKVLEYHHYADFNLKEAMRLIMDSVQGNVKDEWLENFKICVKNTIKLINSTNGVCGVSLYLLDSSKNIFIKEYATKNCVAPKELNIYADIVSEVVYKREASVITKNGMNLNGFGDEDYCEIAALPIQIDRALVGVLIIKSDKKKFFSMRKMNIFQSAATLIERGVDDFTHKHKEAIKGNLYQAFFEIQGIISDPKNHQKVYDLLTELLEKMFSPKRVIFTTIDKNKKQTVIEKVRGLSDVFKDGAVLRDFSTVQQIVLDTKKPLFIENINADVMYGGRFNIENDHKKRLKTLLVIPVITEDKVIGQVFLEYADDRVIRQAHLSLFDKLGRIIGSILEKIHLYREMEEMATYDYLTGLLLKREFITVVRNEIERARRTRLPLSLLFIDVDKFKQVNDTYGHLAGDLVLKKVAEVIHSSIRKVDVAARYAGDEFVVILSNTKADQARISAERIRKNVQNVPVVYRGEKIHVTLSVGIGLLHDGIDDYKDLILEADEAMYTGRKGGKRNLTYFIGEKTT